MPDDTAYSTSTSGVRAGEASAPLFRIRPQAVLWASMGAAVFFLVANAIRLAIMPHIAEKGRAAHVLRWFDTDMEATLPSMYSALILLIASGLLWVCARMAKRMEKPHVSSWRILAIVFGFLSLDEFISIHEQTLWLIAPQARLSGYLIVGWIVVYLPLVVILGLFVGRWFLALPSRTRFLGGLSAFIFLLGAVGFEMLSSKVWDDMGRANYWEAIVSPKYLVLASLEEFFEMAGVGLWVYTLTDYIRRLQVDVEFVKIEPRL